MVNKALITFEKNKDEYIFISYKLILLNKPIVFFLFNKTINLIYTNNF